MEHRQLGRTGVSVSKLCLGAMMFGAWGNPDHDESIRIIHRALDAGINFVDTADVYSQGESEEIVGKALAGGKREDVVLATKVWGPMGEDPNRAWQLAPLDHPARSRTRCGASTPTGSTSTRSTATSPAPTSRRRSARSRDLVRQGKVRYVGSSTFPPSAIVEAQWMARDRQPPAVCLRAAAVLDPRPRHRGRRAARPARVRDGRHPVEPAGRRLAVGPLAQGTPTQPGSHARRAASRRATTCRCPPTSASSTPPTSSPSSPTRPGIPLVQLAIAFVAQPSGRHGGDHRAAHDGAPREPAAGSRPRPGRGATRPHRRDRPARHEHQPRRRRLVANPALEPAARRR